MCLDLFLTKFSELDTKTDKREEKERAVLDQLTEELSNAEKGGADSVIHLRRLEEEFRSAFGYKTFISHVA